MTTMYTAMAAKQRRFVDVERIGRLNEIARRCNAGQTVGHSPKQQTTHKHSR